ncbi:sulfatase-like hydrolase/transferase [Bacteroidota bacterium]
MNMRINQLLCILAVLSFFTGCTVPNEQLPPPNIVWINCEDISPALGCYGDDYAITPVLDKLADDGVVYTNAFATAPICAPSRSCLITGVYATSLGTQHLRCEIKKPDFIRTFPEYLKDAGYFTTNYAKTDYNFSPEGIYDYWDQDLAPWRKREGDQPFFTFFVIGGTHEGPANHPERYVAVVKNLPEEYFHDPDKCTVPPYYPNTAVFREMWAKYYDLISALDIQIGKIMQNLENDGLMENTIVFFFSDHGFGHPRYKRWLYSTGLQVPMIVYAPPKYQHFLRNKPGQENDDLISFIDFAPSVLSLAGVNIPDHMQGNVFAGENTAANREYIFGARSRADDMYEMSRAIRNKDFIYIRHFMPHLPYIQPGIIFADQKWSFRELRKMHEAGTLPPESEEMWHPKPAEELYDLRNDPDELTNIADQEEYQDIKTELHRELNKWMVDTRDVGLLFEPEYMIRGASSTPYEMAQDPDQFNVESILQAAEKVGLADIESLMEDLKNEDSGVRFWAAMGITEKGEAGQQAIEGLKSVLDDPSPSVSIQAAEALCQLGACEIALPYLEKWVKDERPWLALQAARSLQLIGENAKPLVPVMFEVLESTLGEPGGRLKWKDFNYSAFTYWALEYALLNCGEEIPE